MYSGFTTFMQFIGFVIIFGSVLFLVIITTKLLGNKARIAMKGKYINVIETVSIGFDKQLHVIRAGEEFILISSSGKKIEFLTKITIKDIISETDEEEKSNKFDFKTLFEKYIKTDKKTTNKIHSAEGSKNNIFKRNIDKIRELHSFTNDKDGIEKDDRD